MNLEEKIKDRQILRHYYGKPSNLDFKVDVSTVKHCAINKNTVVCENKNFQKGIYSRVEVTLCCKEKEQTLILEKDNVTQIKLGENEELPSIKVLWKADHIPCMDLKENNTKAFLKERTKAYYNLCGFFSPFKVKTELKEILKSLTAVGLQLELKIKIFNCLQNASIKNSITVALSELFKTKLKVGEKEQIDLSELNAPLFRNYFYGVLHNNVSIKDPLRQDYFYKDNTFFYNYDEQKYYNFRYDGYRKPLKLSQLKEWMKSSAKNYFE